MHRLKRFFTLAALAGCASYLHAAEPVSFNWFSYTGNDPQQQAPAAGEYQNPIFTGFYPDPSICRVGDDYYLINSTFAYYPGIPIFHSRDLVNWEQIGNVIHRPNQLPYDGLGVSRGIFAPAISYHDGTFYVVCTMVDAGGNFVVTAKDPKGPWSDPVWTPFEGIDPSIFFDEDGRAWMVNNGAPDEKPRYSGHRAIWIQEFDTRSMKMVGPRKVLVNGGVDISQKPVWIEGPHLYKKDGWYYLCCAEGGTSVNHSQVIFRSKQVDGPYEPWSGNPILTQRPLDGKVPFAVTSTGHADLVIGPDKQWWAVFLAVRPYEGRFSPMGRETFLLPVTWTEDGWPVILEKDKRVPLVHAAPAGATLKPMPLPLNGNFTNRDEFDGEKLAQHWLMLRAPKTDWWSLQGGHLRIEPRAEHLNGTGNPSFIARRVQHAHFSASTELVIPSEPSVAAGLAVFQGEGFHYFLSVSNHDGSAQIQLEKVSKGEAATVKSAPIAGKTVRLKAEGDGPQCRFLYAENDGDWKVLAEGQDARLLTTDVAGGFVGATVGMHARIDNATTNRAH